MTNYAYGVKKWRGTTKKFSGANFQIRSGATVY